MHKLSVCVVFILFCNLQTQGNVVKISVYYESLCPDSIRFIVQQVYPTFEQLGKFISLDLVPFGKATAVRTRGKWNFHCQHGPKECYGNKIQSCAIALNNITKSAVFVDCAMGSTDPSSPSILRQCSQESGIAWQSLEVCLKNGDADKLLAINGQRTHAVKPPISFIPTVLFNNVFDESEQDEALSDLQKVVCNLLNNEPAPCDENNINLLMV